MEQLDMGLEAGEELVDDPELDEAEKPTDPGMTPEALAEYWTKEVNAAKKWLDKFHVNGKKIEGIYLSEDQEASTALGKTHFNLFWSNVQVILAASYAKLPTVDVSRKFKDFEDDVSRVAGIMIQRIINSDTYDVSSNTDETFKNVLLDRFVPGMGQVWCRYDFKEVEQKNETTGEMVPAIAEEMAPVDHVRWEDFLYSPCRTWAECRWGARKHYMDKERLEEKFGEKIAAQVKLSVKVSTKAEYEDPRKAVTQDQGVVYEIWDKDSKRLYWYSEGCPVILGYDDDPLKLNGFFPFPKPLVGTVTTKNFISRAEYIILQDQYAELEMVTRRLTILSEALRVVGAYDKEVGALSEMLTGTTTNKMVPVENWALFAEKGGIKGVVDWFPLEVVASTLEKLTVRKRELMQEIYEILGISDLMRGSTKASETATAQKLKAQFGGARVDTMQKSIAKFMSETMQLRAEIICKHWQPQSIIEKSHIMATPDAALAGPAVQLLKSQGNLNAKLEVLSETIAAPDWEAEKQQRTDFLQAISQFIGMSMPLIQAEPGSVPFLVKIIQWAAAGFQSGKTLEGVLDQALQSLQQSMSVPKPPPPPTPEDDKNAAQAKNYTADAAKKLFEMGVDPAMAIGMATAPKPGVNGGPPGGPAVSPNGPPNQTIQ
jgi:hypothetical protein